MCMKPMMTNKIKTIELTMPQNKWMKIIHSRLLFGDHKHLDWARMFFKTDSNKSILIASPISVIF